MLIFKIYTFSRNILNIDRTTDIVEAIYIHVCIISYCSYEAQVETSSIVGQQVVAIGM